MKVGLIGCGAIGGTLAQAIIDGKAGEVEIVAICDEKKSRTEELNKRLSIPNLFLTTDLEEFISRDNIDLVIEAASQKAVMVIAEKVLNAGKHLLIMSVGALRDKVLLSNLKKLAKEKEVKVYLPSGAVCGLDGVKSASIERIKSVEIISTKNPISLEGSPYLIENNIKISSLTTPKIVFDGNAGEAAKGFPKSVNVAVALSLAGIGVDRTIVKIIADPKAIRTQHEIKVAGDFGELYTIVKNFIHPENPKTSYLAALSAIRTLRKLTEPIQVGT